LALMFIYYRYYNASSHKLCSWTKLLNVTNITLLSHQMFSLAFL